MWGGWYCNDTSVWLKYKNVCYYLIGITFWELGWWLRDEEEANWRKEKCSQVKPARAWAQSLARGWGGVGRAWPSGPKDKAQAAGEDEVPGEGPQCSLGGPSSTPLGSSRGPQWSGKCGPWPRTPGGAWDRFQIRAWNRNVHLTNTKYGICHYIKKVSGCILTLAYFTHPLFSPVCYSGTLSVNFETKSWSVALLDSGFAQVPIFNDWLEVPIHWVFGYWKNWKLISQCWY